MFYLSRCDSSQGGCDKTFPSDLGDCPYCKLPQMFTVMAPVDPRDYVYDIETYPNIFTCCVIHVATGKKWKFEISTRVDQYAEFAEFVRGLGHSGARGVGFNNLGFDYPVVHWMIHNPGCTVDQIYNYAMRIIESMKAGDKFGFLVWDRDQIFQQVDLFKIHHFDNAAKMTSLKSLEFCMNMHSVEDLPFPVGQELTHDQMDVLHNYNLHDCDATAMFYVRTLDMIRLRETLGKKFNQNFINMSDVKMGEQVLITEMQKNGIECFEYVNGRKAKKQTWRHSINLGDVIFPYVKFEHPEFERIRAHLASQTIAETKGVFTGLVAQVDGLKYAFGTGGIHASVESTSIHSNDAHQLVDVDVASFYPNMGIVNKLYPAHLGTQFCDAYLSVYETRKQYNKKTHPMENGAFKLALNGAYGGSNNKYSPFYDPFYTMSITINGQLLLCMLVEQLIKIPGLSMVQANTDGVTFYCPHEYLDHSRAICKWWEGLTCLELEEVLYDSMFIRDVNSYMAVYQGGGVKRIGCYAYETAEEKPGTREVPYNKDWSALVIPKAAEAALVHGKDIREFIMNHPIDRDFYLRAKVPRSNTLVMRWSELDIQIELNNIIRYYVSVDGGSLFKLAPPTGVPGSWKRKPKVPDDVYQGVIREIQKEIEGLEIVHRPEIVGTPVTNLGCTVGNWSEEWHVMKDGEKVIVDSTGLPHDERIHTKNKSKHEERKMGISVGWLCTDCSNLDDFDRSTLNYEYYISEAEKIVKPLRNCS